MRPIFLLCVLFASLATSPAWPQDCRIGDPGLTLAVTPAQVPVGTPVLFTLRAPPGTAVMLMASLGGGPTPSPFGPFCLSLPLLAVFPLMTVPASGEILIPCAIPCIPSSVGHRVFLQFLAFPPRGGAGRSNAASFTLAPGSCGYLFLIIDEDSIDNGNPPNFFSDRNVNDDIARVGQRTPLRYFEANVGHTITLHTGQVGDEGWFAPKVIPPTWAAAGPTQDGLRNYLGQPTRPHPHDVGPGLGAGSNPEVLLDKIPRVTPLRATALKMLEGQDILAVVYDSDISVNYAPLQGNLQGANLGTVAFKVLSVTALTGFSSSSLPQVRVRILSVAEVIQRGPGDFFVNAPEPSSSSTPFDVIPPP
jgi:hypothetical protein